MSNPLLEIRDLHTHFFTDEGVVRAVDGLDFTIERGKTLCLVGESGCGKSVTAYSILQLIQSPGKIVQGEILLHRDGETVDLAALSPRGKEIRTIRGKEISMIFQEPMSSLSSMHTIGDQITEIIQLHLLLTEEDAKSRTIELLRRVGIPRAEDRFDTYPFQLSGGMRQRATIAMMLSCNPALLIADEPTTALDVTTQAGILDLIKDLQQEHGMAVLFITHDLGVVAEIADEVVVMYLGQLAERGDVDSIFHYPKHPYTKALLKSIPRLSVKPARRLASIRGMVPHPFRRPKGCPFSPRCERSMRGVCDLFAAPRERMGEGREVRCLMYSDVDRLRQESESGGTSE